MPHNPAEGVAGAFFLSDFSLRRYCVCGFRSSVAAVAGSVVVPLSSVTFLVAAPPTTSLAVASLSYTGGVALHALRILWVRARREGTQGFGAVPKLHINTDRRRRRSTDLH